MRIVAGEHKGRVIESPSEKTTRPTTDRVRESIFSSVYSRVSELGDISVLDAFAGSGALGIEALSRGAKNCLFVEHDRQARHVLERNIDSLAFERPCVRVTSDDAFTLPERLVARDSFGLVLLDPPYAYEPTSIYELLSGLAAKEHLDDGCVIVYEHAIASRQAVDEAFEDDGRFELTGQKKYGKIGVTYLKYCQGEE